jgi:hypothetical protein
MKKDRLSVTFSLSSRLIALLLIIATHATGQSDWGRFSAKGHLQFLESVWMVKDSEKWLTSGTMNNRLDFSWNKGSLSANAGMRNIMQYGSMVYDFYPWFNELSTQETGSLDFTHRWHSDSSVYIYSTFDRANVRYSRRNLEIILGRQRINWGVNLVWNPNDIFNTFNYFDFDYAERPGCDAVSVQYFTGMTSSLQLAWKIENDNRHTIAGMYRFNQWNYDFQLMGGVMRDDLVLGAGWSGDIKGAGFNGEATWFRPYENFSDTSATLIISAGANYTFPNSLYLHTGFIYNSGGSKEAIFNPNLITFNSDLSAKTLTLSRAELFAEAAFQFSPLIRGNFAAIINPFDASFFAGPSIDISLSDNVGFLITSQLFFGDDMTQYGSIGSLVYGRLKWSF